MIAVAVRLRDAGNEAVGIFWGRDLQDIRNGVDSVVDIDACEFVDIGPSGGIIYEAPTSVQFPLRLPEHDADKQDWTTAYFHNAGLHERTLEMLTDDRLWWLPL